MSADGAPPGPPSDGSDTDAPAAEGPRPGGASAPRPPLRADSLPSRSATTIVVAWIIACIVLATWTGGDLFRASGDVQGLLPARHHSPVGEPWLLLRLEGPVGERAPEELLDAAALAIAEGLPDERVPLAPPVNAVRGWLDAHGLYLLPEDRHATLEQRLKKEAIQRSVGDLKARLSSPLFGVSGEDVRRDPLALRGVLLRSSGMLGHVDDTTPGAPIVTNTGDLLASDGRSLLIQLRTSRPPEPLLQEVRQLVEPFPVRADLLGPGPEQASAERRTERAAGRMLPALAAGLIMVLTLALRRVAPVLALGGCLATGLLAMLAIAAPLDPFELALLSLMAGFACDLALRLQPMSSRGWASALVMLTALLPLALSPYPEWQRWSWQWLIAGLALVVAMRAVLPAINRLVGADMEWPTAGFHLRPMPLLAVLLCGGLTAAGAWSAEQVQVQAADAVSFAEPDFVGRSRFLADQYFDPSLIVETAVMGDDPASALDASARTAPALAALVPEQVRRVDSPGSYVIPAADLARRRASLAELGLQQQMQALYESLEEQGLRPDAFGEFLRGATDIESIPDAQQAIDGPLGGWLERYVDNRDGRSMVRTRIELLPDGDVPVVAGPDGDALPFEGPRAFGRFDETQLRNRLGVYILVGMWLGAFLVWLGTGNLAIAIAAALTSLTAQAATLVSLVLLEQPLGPHLLPALLLVGAAATVAGGRACRSVELDQPTVASGLLVTGTCQVIGGLALLVSAEPLWRQIGLAASVGCALAAGLGLFVAPGMAELLLRVFRRRGPGGGSPANDGPTRDEGKEPEA